MKRLHIAVILIALSLAVGVFEVIYVNNTYNKCYNAIEKSKGYFSDNEYTDAYIMCKNAESQWNKSSKTLSIFLVHSQISDVSNTINELKDAVKGKDKKEFSSLYKKTKRQLLFIKKSELPDFENIL